MSDCVATLHLAQDLRSEYDELAITDHGTEVGRVAVTPTDDHAPYRDALAAAGWTLTSPVTATEWTVTRTAA